MLRLSKSCLVAIGVMAIAVGALHLYVHFNELVSDEIQKQLSGSIAVMGSTMDVYRAWQGFSFMMGVSFVVIGLLAAINGLSRDAPSTATFLVLIAFLAAVIYSGVHFFGTKQIYAGGAGVVIAIIGLVARLRSTHDRSDLRLPR